MPLSPRGAVACLAVAAAITIAAAGGPSAAAGHPPHIDASASVDFSKRVHVGNALGFMHGGVKRLPADVQARVQARASELKPSIWRGVPQAWSIEPSIVKSVGADPVIQLGDIWGLPGHWPSVWPDQNLNAYSAWVTARAASIKAWFPTGTVWVDVWNEPDSRSFWPVGRDPKLLGYFSAYRTAERALRETLGSRVRVIGPSTAGSATLWTERLVEYCAHAGCHIDGVAWHANFQRASLMAGLGAAMRRVRARVAANASWRRVVRQPLDFLITEYVSSSKRADPGAMLSYWGQIEKGGGGHAAFSVWKVDTPSDGLLDALLDAEGHPRDGWWAARAYALGRTSRVRTSSNSALWPVLASSKGLAGRRELLVGSWANRAGRVAVCMKGLPSRRLTVRATTFRPSVEPWQGNGPKPRWIRTATLRPVHGRSCIGVYVPAESVRAVSIG